MCHIDFWSGELGQTSKRCILRSRQCLPQTGRKFSFRYCRDIFSNVVSYKEAAKAAKKRSPSEISLSSSSVKRSRWLVSGLRCYLSISLRTFHMFHTSTTTTFKTFPSPRNVITFGHNYPTSQCISLIFNNKKIYDNKKRFRRVRGDNMFHFSQIVDLALSVQRFPFRWAIIYLIGQA